jgi:hypothetical protein
MEIEFFTCSLCGKTHPRSDAELSFKRPDAINDLPEAERAAQSILTEDLASLDLANGDHRFFVRCVLPLRVYTRASDYCLGLWAEVSGADFTRIRELWSEPMQADEPPFAATLANDVPSHERALGLRLNLHLTGPASRPTLTVADDSHSLYLEQTQGISGHRVHEYNSYF